MIVDWLNILIAIKWFNGKKFYYHSIVRFLLITLPVHICSVDQLEENMPKTNDLTKISFQNLRKS